MTYERMGEYANDLAMEDAARQWDAQSMDAQQYAMSGLETHHQQEAAAAAEEAERDCFVCWSFPNSCSRPEHDCDLHRVSIEEMRRNMPSQWNTSADTPPPGLYELEVFDDAGQRIPMKVCDCCGLVVILPKAQEPLVVRGWMKMEKI